jgi:hypothetical protein
VLESGRCFACVGQAVMRRRWLDGRRRGRLATWIRRWPCNCHYYKLGNYITACKPGQDLRRRRRTQAPARLSHRHGPPVEMISCCRPVCVSWAKDGLDGYQVGKSIRSCRSRRRLETRRKLVVHVARAIRLAPLASSTANPHVDLFLSSPAASVVGGRCPSQRRGGGAVHYPFYHYCTAEHG